MAKFRLIYSCDDQSVLYVTADSMEKVKHMEYETSVWDKIYPYQVSTCGESSYVEHIEGNKYKLNLYANVTSEYIVEAENTEAVKDMYNFCELDNIIYPYSIHQSGETVDIEPINYE